MTPAETTSNGIKTASDRELLEQIIARLEILRFQVEDLAEQSARRDEHHDTVLHSVTQFIDEHKPLIKRFTDPGAAVRGFLPGAKNGKKKP